jgi:hypothetical protein
MSFHLRNADITLKLFITAFLVVLTIGYAIGLFFVEHQTSFTPRGVQEQFLGNEESAQEIRYAKSANEMFVFMHNHILSMSLVFLALNTLFYFSSAPPKLKVVLMVEPFAAILTTFGGIALVRYVSDAWSWLVVISGVSLFVSYVVIVGMILRDLWLQGNSAANQNLSCSP